MEAQNKKGHKALAIIMAVLAAVLIAKGIYIFMEGGYTLSPRYGPKIEISGMQSVLYGVASCAEGLALGSTIFYLAMNRSRLAIFTVIGFGIISVLCRVASFFVE